MGDVSPIGEYQRFRVGLRQHSGGTDVAPKESIVLANCPRVRSCMLAWVICSSAPGFMARTPALESRLSRLAVLVHFAIQPPNPSQIRQKLPTRDPDKGKYVLCCQLFCPLAGVGFYPPAKILATPGSQPVAARRIPQKSYWSKQCVSL